MWHDIKAGQARGTVNLLQVWTVPSGELIPHTDQAIWESTWFKTMITACEAQINSLKGEIEELCRGRNAWSDAPRNAIYFWALHQDLENIHIPLHIINLPPTIRSGIHISRPLINETIPPAIRRISTLQLGECLRYLANEVICCPEFAVTGHQVQWTLPAYCISICTDMD